MDIDDILFDDEEEQLDDHFYTVDVSVQQRNSKKTWTVISNINVDAEKKKEVLQKIKKKLSCNGSVDENGNLRLNGNHKDSLAEILCQELKLQKNKIRIH